MHLKLEVLDAALPLVELGLSQPLAEISLLTPELVDLGFQSCDAIVTSHESKLPAQAVAEPEPNVPSPAAASAVVRCRFPADSARMTAAPPS
jgi:hypothetical protein